MVKALGAYVINRPEKHAPMRISIYHSQKELVSLSMSLGCVVAVGEIDSTLTALERDFRFLLGNLVGMRLLLGR